MLECSAFGDCALQMKMKKCLRRRIRAPAMKELHHSVGASTVPVVEVLGWEQQVRAGHFGLCI